MNRALRVCLLSMSLLGAASPQERPIEAPGPDGPLAGTLAGPGTAQAPTILIIPGSGPTDRDGNNPMGVRAGTYRLLAEGLAADGITTVRIDKRGMFASKAAVPDPNAVTIADYVTDVRHWVASIRAKTGAPCVWLFGHSEGGLVAMAAAREPGICGLILAAAPGRRLGDIMRAQLRANPANAPVLAQAEAAIAALEAGRHADTTGMHPALLPLFRPAVQNFLIGVFALDPVKLIAGVGKPVLILQGTRDLQVTEADARALAAADPHAKLVLLADTTHVLKPVHSGDMAANFATYGDENLPLAPGVVEAIAQFVEPR
jgi:pimeloyl-ACP methyl ester carboxylesterase